MEKAIVLINGHEYSLKFTVGFWKKIQEDCGVTQSNIDQKLKEDFGNIASAIVYWGIYYGLPQRVPVSDMPIKMQDIEDQLEKNVMDVIEQAVINGMTKAELEMVEIAQKQRQSKIQEIKDEIDDVKKKG